MPRVILATVLMVSIAAGCSQDQQDLGAVAEAFEPNPGWTLIERADVQEPVCVGRRCTTVVKRWETAELPTAQELRTRARDADWDDVEVDACEPKEDRTGSFPFCYLTAVEGDADVELTVSGPLSADKAWNVTLRVRRAQD